MVTMDSADLLHCVCETSFAYLVLGNESWQAHRATFIRNAGTPRRYGSNCAGLVLAESEAPVLITISVGDSPKHMYATMGFRPPYVMRTWTKRVDAAL